MSLDGLLRAGSPLRYEPVSMGNGKVPEDGLPTAGAAYGPLLRVSDRTGRGQACSAVNQPIGCCLLVHGDCDVAWIWLNLRCP